MKYLVATTINPPTDAICRLRDRALDLGWKMVVVGDRKTPDDFRLDGADFLSVRWQQEHFGRLASLIPFNHYSRKNIGYLYALENGAEVIIETDDDNVPYGDRYPNFLPPKVKSPFVEGRGAINVYPYFGAGNIWPRGLPLDSIGRCVNQGSAVEREVTCYVQQMLVDLDPDVDAIYRLTSTQRDIVFDSSRRLTLSSGCYAPFNTQNTVFYKEAFPLLLLPVSVGSRVTDIWRGYIAQRLLWIAGSNLLFLSPSVYHVRNRHVLMEDFMQELPLYTRANELIRLLDGFSTELNDVSDTILELYRYLRSNEILSDADVLLCKLWTEAVKKHV